MPARMSEHYLGRDPTIYDTCSPELQRQVIRDVLDNFDSGASYESCCWAAEIPPDVFTRWRNLDPRLEKRCRQKLAQLEIEHVRVMRGLHPKKSPDGELWTRQQALASGWEPPTQMQQRMAHEALKVLSKYWAPKQQGAQLAAGLEELSKSLPAETYALVVNTLHKHIDA